MSYLYYVTNEFINGNSILYPVTHRFVKKDGDLYPIAHKFVKSSIEPTQTADFAFVIYGDQYIVDYLSGDALNFTIDWGDGTETVVNSTQVAMLDSILNEAKRFVVPFRSSRYEYRNPNLRTADFHHNQKVNC